MSSFVIGESLIDVVHDGTAEPTQLPGGSPLNVAVGLARLGRNTTLLTRIGEDELGDIIFEHLADAGVRLAPKSIDDHPTSTADAVIDESRSATYTFELHSDYPEPPVGDELAALLADPPNLVHIGSIGAHLEPGASRIKQWLKLLHDHATVTYDPNVRLGVVGPREKLLADIDSLMPFIDVVKASEDDLEELFGKVDLHAAAQYFLDAGASLVVVSQGSAGLALYTPEHTVVVPAADVKVVDTVGAGDSLMSALIDGLGRLSVLGAEERHAISHLSRSMLASLGSYAAAAAGITVTRQGANPPTRAELGAATELYSPSVV